MGVTDLYYVGRTDLGNENLEPEKALSEEIGLKYFGANFNAYVAVFNRSSDNLIDYTKENEADKWEATNLKSLNSTGAELNLSSSFKSGLFTQNISLGAFVAAITTSRVWTECGCPAVGPSNWPVACTRDGIPIPVTIRLPSLASAHGIV